MRNNQVRLNNGMTIPIIGMGTYSLENDKKATEHAVQMALKMGYTHFDTAQVYVSEPALGNALNEAISNGLIDRESIFVTSKLWNLGMEYLDMYLVHWPIKLKPWVCHPLPKEEDFEQLDMETTWAGMEKCLEMGLCKGIGGLKQMQTVVNTKYLCILSRIASVIGVLSALSLVSVLLPHWISFVPFIIWITTLPLVVAWPMLYGAYTWLRSRITTHVDKIRAKMVYRETSLPKANPAPAPLTRKRSALVIREPPVSSALTSIEEVRLGEEEDEEPSLLRKNSKLACLEATPEAVTVQPSTDTASRDDRTSMVTQLIPNPVPPSLAGNVSTSELPTATASSIHEPVPVTDMGIPFTPSPSPPLSESSPATTVEPNQVSVPSSVVPPDPMPSSSAVPVPLAPPEGMKSLSLPFLRSS
ncbi:hypothetical protein BUALT_Bualt01G0203900 [Buddleja alternifolia]|uniref:NADP-dependent oxidoreductase domain-containing protein n=1 Tax=Buddleja alternifolia TaxID=168488 RepID=A0AAV6Y8P6_9LAMI|nr:hypothetical protein BUALT_Bualt01G0203900 [Buddleja alternifolia]